MPVQSALVPGPISYEMDGEQYIAVNAGWGGGAAQIERGAGTALHRASARLLVFWLGGRKKLPPLPPAVAIPNPLPLRASEAVVQKGAEIFARTCAQCHGQLAVGGVKDLRQMNSETHAQFNDIVLKGTRAERHGQLRQPAVGAGRGSRACLCYRTCQRGLGQWWFRWWGTPLENTQGNRHERIQAIQQCAPAGLPRGYCCCTAGQQPLNEQESLDDAVIQNERERERRASPAFSARNPDVIAVSRVGGIFANRDGGIVAGAANVSFGARDPLQSRIRRKTAGDGKEDYAPGDAFRTQHRRQADAARGHHSTGCGRNEDDGLPAAIPFGSRSSLINIDYLRLKNGTTPTLVNVRNVIDPQTRRCEPYGGWIDDGQPFSNRFLFLSNTLDECRSALQGRHGDLLVAEGVPEKLREDLFELYDPLFVRFSMPASGWFEFIAAARPCSTVHSLPVALSMAAACTLRWP